MTERRIKKLKNDIRYRLQETERRFIILNYKKEESEQITIHQRVRSGRN